MGELTAREYEQVLDTFRTASEWHGGQFSALYSYSSTGKIWSAEHRENLLVEIDAELDKIEDGLGDADLTNVELEALQHLRYAVECWPNEAI